MAWLYTIASVLIISLASFIGVLFISFREETLKKILLILVSFSAGALFGGAFLHLIPEALEHAKNEQQVFFFVLSGIIAFFILEKLLCWRHCHIPTSDSHPHPIAYMNLIGDGFHNFIDGAIIAASYLVSIPLGIATSIAVIAHEIPQEIGDFGVLVHGGFSRGKALMMNFLSALTAVLGALLVLLLSMKVETMTAFLVPFTAGGFIYIAGSDLIPELKKETGPFRTLLQLAAILCGIGLMLAIMHHD